MLGEQQDEKSQKAQNAQKLKKYKCEISGTIQAHNTIYQCQSVTQYEMRHLRHKKIERTMHYIRAIVLPLEEDIEFEHVITHNYDEEGKAIDNGWTLVRARTNNSPIQRKA